VWTVIHLVLIGGIAAAGIYVYGKGLGVWVAASAIVAGAVSLYLFAKNVPGETIMKVLLYTAAAANAAYLVHNGARYIGIEMFNAAQVKKHEASVSGASKTKSGRVAREIMKSSEESTTLERAFDDTVSIVAAALAFLEIAIALVCFAIASARLNEIRRRKRQRQAWTDEQWQQYRPAEFPAEEAFDVRPTGPLPKVQQSGKF
jgi:hypothetical protein